MIKLLGVDTCKAILEALKIPEDLQCRDLRVELASHCITVVKMEFMLSPEQIKLIGEALQK